MGDWGTYSGYKGVAKTWQEVHGHMELLQTQYFGQ